MNFSTGSDAPRGWGGRSSTTTDALLHFSELIQNLRTIWTQRHRFIGRGDRRVIGFVEASLQDVIAMQHLFQDLLERRLCLPVDLSNIPHRMHVFGRRDHYLTICMERCVYHPQWLHYQTAGQDSLQVCRGSLIQM